MNYDTRHNPSPAGTAAVLADDGRTLPITVREPAGPPRGVVLVVPAMATPESYYAPFAEHLAARGWRTVTFTFRGMRDTAAMRAETADLDRWIADVRAILDVVADEAGDLPVSWVGHSLGGQVVPFVDHARLAAVATVASGDGYWRRNSPGVRWIAPALWRVVSPVATRVAGYFPGGRLGMVGDLPTGVMRQWGRWCLHPEYLHADHPGAAQLFAEVKVPIMSLSFTDDEMMSAESISHLHDWYSSAEQVRQRYSPAQLEVPRMGHHGFFRREHAALWDELLLPWLA